MLLGTVGILNERIICFGLLLVFVGSLYGADEAVKLDEFVTRPSIRSVHGEVNSRAVKDDRSWRDVLNEILTPEEACKAVSSRVQYTSDISLEDEWRTGAETWQRMKGDCEDFALAITAIGVSSSWDAEIYVFSSPTVAQSHAVVIGTYNGNMWMSSNGSYERIQSLYDAKERVVRSCGWWFPEVEGYIIKVNRDGEEMSFAKVAVDG